MGQIARHLLPACLTGFFAVQGPLPAVALEGILGPAIGAEACYARSYSPSHLAQNPAQRVTAMRVAFRRETYPGSVGVAPQAFIRVEVTRRGETKAGVWRAIGGCAFDAKANLDTSARRLIRNYPRLAGILCNMTGEGLDSEGGVLMVERLRQGLRLYADDSITMRKGGNVSDGPGTDIAFGAADGVFQLEKVENGACAALNAGIIAQ